MIPDYPELLLKPGRHASLKRGHPWLFSGAIADTPRGTEAGALVRVVSSDRRPVALGFFNPRTDIAFRLLTTDTGSLLDAAFWQRRIQSALALRSRVVPPRTTAYRLINAEGDFMPGLIVDRYGDYLVLSVETQGMERLREELIDILRREVQPRGIYERSDGSARRREGLPARVGAAWGAAPPASLEITENGIAFEVDIVSGQKTGFFLDQRPNRMALETLSAGADVLNCFSYTGAFSLYCLRGGARRVISVEASLPANEAARRNLARNGYPLEPHPVVQADVFDYLRAGDETFDLVILDPPAFARSRSDVRGAERGYKDINLRAAHRVREGGLLATFSCSNHIERELFEKIVLSAVSDAGRTARLLAVFSAGPDHPTNLAHGEGRYLKGMLLSLDS